MVAALATSSPKILVSFHRPAYLAVIGPIMALALFSLLFLIAKLGMLITMSLGVKGLELYSEPVFIMDNKGNKAYMNPECTS